MRDSVVFYRSFRDAIKDLPKKDQLKAYDAIFDYAFDGVEPDATGGASAVFKLIKPQVDANEKKWRNGLKGGRPSQKNNQTETKPKPNNNQAETKPEPNVNVNENENVNDNVNDKAKRTRFIPPSVDEVRDYCRERENGVDPEIFVDFYSAKGWKVGSTTMKDWRACVRTWEKRSRDKPPEKKGHFANERIYDFESIERQLVKGATT